MNSHTSNTYIDTDNLLQITTAHKPQNPLPHIPCLQAAHTMNKLQSLGVGLRTMQYRHTFSEDSHLKYSPPALLVQPFLQSIYTHAQIYSQHEIP